MPKLISQAKKFKIKRMYDAGEKIEYIALVTGVSFKSICRIASQLGSRKRSKNNEKFVRLTPEYKAALIKAYNEDGERVVDICKKFKISRPTLYKWCGYLQLELRRGRPLRKDPTADTLYYREYSRVRRAEAIAKELGYT